MDAYPLRGTYSPVGDNGMPLDRPLTEAEFAILTGTESYAVQVAADVPQHSMPCTNRSWHPIPFSDANLSAIMNNASPIEICPSSLALSDRHGQAGAASSQYTLPTMQSHGSVHPRTLSASVPSHPPTVQMGGDVPSWAAWVSPGDFNLHVGTGPAAVRMRHAARPPSLPDHSCLPASIIDRARADYLEQSIFPPANLHLQGAGVRSDQMPCLDRGIQEVGDLGALCGDVPADALTSTGYQDPDIGLVWEDIPMYDSHLQHFRPPPQFPRMGGITSAPTGWQATQASSHEETPSFSTYPPIEFGSAATALNSTDLVFTNRTQPAAFVNHSTVTGVPTATQLMDGEMPAGRPSQPYADSIAARARNRSGGVGGKCSSLPEMGCDGPRDPHLPIGHDQEGSTPPVCLCTPSALDDPPRDEQTTVVSAPENGAPVTYIHFDPNSCPTTQAPSGTKSLRSRDPCSNTRVFFVSVGDRHGRRSYEKHQRTKSGYVLTADRRTAQQVLEAGRRIWSLSDNKATVDFYRRKLEDLNQEWSGSFAAECSKRGVHATLQVANSKSTYDRDFRRVQAGVRSPKADFPAVLLWAERDNTLREAGLDPDACPEMLPYYLRGKLYLDLAKDPKAGRGTQLVRNADDSGWILVEQGAAEPPVPTLSQA